jgi:predicted ATPase/DNA-binding SARP family transcriptional activator
MNSATPSEPGVSICLLGGCKFYNQGKIIRLETAKTSALLAYLALQSKPTTRHKLLGLFWGDQPEKNARRSLRHALWNIRQAFQASDRAEILMSEGQEIAIDPVAGVWIDVLAFESCLKREAEIGGANPCPDDRCGLLRQAADLYCGNLLDGLLVNDAAEFEQWLLMERERLQARAVESLQRLVRHSVEWGEYAVGLEYACRLLALEPWLEEGHRQTMRLLALSGQRAAALTAYETCRRVLAEELNVEPSRETQELYELIRAGTDDKKSWEATSLRRLPAQATPFVGREEELGRLAIQLADPTCRLITLAGPGGIGKSRLAVRAAAGCVGFPDGVYFVALTGVASSGLVATAVADRLGVELHGGESLQAQVIEWLREKELLLVLDNFEHLLPAAEWVAELLREAPGIKLLVTSRERLALRDEWTFPVEGLRFPPQGAEARSETALDQYAAVQLFVQGAQRVRLGYELSKADKPRVARLCRLVDGTPLAIELAASWVRLLTCDEIVTHVEQSLDLLTTDQRDVPARHRSMRAVFEQSWQMLGEEGQGVFKRLTVFRGGFRQEAAEVVARATLEQLASLVDKSFLKRTPSGRYEIHELHRQYGEKKLSEAEAAQVREAHGIYFAQYLATREIVSAREKLKEVLEEIAEDIENIRSGWEWAIEQRRVAEIGQACLNLHYYYELRSWVQEGETVFDRTIAALSTLAPEPEQQIVLERLYNMQGIFCNRLSLYSKAVRVLQASLSIARQVDPSRAVAPMANLATTQFLHGAFWEARQLLEESLVIYRQLDNWLDFYTAQSSLGYVLCLLGDYPHARILLDQAMEAFQSIGMQDNLAFTHCYLGLVAQGEKDFRQAILSLEKGLAIFRSLGHAWGTAACLASLARIALQNGEAEQARRQAQEGLTQARLAGSPYIEALCLNCMGLKASMEGHDTEAFGYHYQAIRTAWETEQIPPVLDGLIGLADLELKGGRPQPAGELLAFVIHHPSTVASERNRATELFSRLESLLAPEGMTNAKEQGEAESLETVVGRLLASHRHDGSPA